MKRMILMVALAAIVAAPAWAFHDGGVAHCNGCHTMHNSQDGALVDPDSPNGNAFLLVDATPSDVCLGCHATGDLGAVSRLDPLAPGTEYGGGNFIFLLEDNLNDGHAGATEPDPGRRGRSQHRRSRLRRRGRRHPDAVARRHLPGSASWAAPAATTRTATRTSGCSTAPAVWSRTSSPFTNPAPIADGLALFGAGETNTNHTAYQGGMSAWCGNCHGDFHNNNTQLIHPSGQTLGGTIASTYNLYNGTVRSDRRRPARPPTWRRFRSRTRPTPRPAPPVRRASSQVSCITCHRAHATSAPDAGRWDFSVTFLHEDGVESGSYADSRSLQQLNQRSLCNKCHNKDEFDENPF